MGGPRGRKITRDDKLCALKLIDEAVNNGCRKKIACESIGLTIRTIQRWEKSEDLSDKRKGPLTIPSNKLSDKERKEIIRIANLNEYSDLPPCQIVPRLADNNIYIASESSFYRVLKEVKQSKYRQKQSKPKHKKPKCYVANGPNQLWSWDISYLPTVVQGVFYYLYFFMDIYSRKIVGYSVHHSEKAEHAIKILNMICNKEGITKEQLVLHSDNGSPMKASTWLYTLRDLGITPSFSRPSVSNDNPYSESLFKTAKYSHIYPRSPFESLKQAKLWIELFVKWYNNDHLHSGLNFISPEERHNGKSEDIIAKRIEVYQKSKATNPNRWSKEIRNWILPAQVNLNPGKIPREAA